MATGRHDGAWPYHQTKDGRMVPCRSNPCSLHGDTDIIASSPEEACRLREQANEAGMAGKTRSLTRDQHTDGSMSGEDIEAFVKRYKPQVRMMNGQEMLNIDKRLAPRDKQSLADFSKTVRANKQAIITWIKDRDARKRKQEEARRERLDTIEGLEEIRQAQGEYAQYMTEVKRAVNGDGTMKPPREPFDMDHIEELHRRYPLADTYLKAMKLEGSHDAGLSSIGSRVIDAIADGADNDTAVRLMGSLKDEWAREHEWLD